MRCSSSLVSFPRLSSLSSSFHPLLPYPSHFFPPSLPSPSPLTVILQNSFLAFMSVSAHFAPGRQRIKSSDRQVLVLLSVLNGMARCRAPVSVWCCLDQHAAAYVQNKGEKERERDRERKRNTDTVLPLSSSTLYFCQTTIFMCAQHRCVNALYVCEWCVKGFLYVFPHHQGSQGKNDTFPTSCQALGPFLWITAAPNSLRSLCKYCSRWHV